ncbi:hypothetical protein VTO42DRAFT_4431 [Malbranchea cinnamomea]
MSEDNRIGGQTTRCMYWRWRNRDSWLGTAAARGKTGDTPILSIDSLYKQRAVHRRLGRDAFAVALRMILEVDGSLLWEAFFVSMSATLDRSIGWRLQASDSNISLSRVGEAALAAVLSDSPGVYFCTAVLYLGSDGEIIPNRYRSPERGPADGLEPQGIGVGDIWSVAMIAWDLFSPEQNLFNN